MDDFNQAESLLRLADVDFSALGGMGNQRIFADSIFGFHVQQAVEKALKAWIDGLGIAYPLTHDLARLMAVLETNGATTGAFVALTRFTPFAVQARYEEGIVTPSDPLDRPAIVAEVSALLEHVRRQVETLSR